MTDLGYRAEVETAHFISADFSRTYTGWRGVVKDADGRTVESCRSWEGRRAKSQAQLDAANAKRRFEHHFRVTGRRLEVERREAREALQAAKAASTERRKALIRDRCEMWRALKEACSAHCPDARRAELFEQLVLRHQQAVLDIEADPENRRGGASEGTS